MYASLSPAALFRRFFSNAGLYAVSIILTRAGWLVLLPIYWTKLTPADFGIIGIAQLLQTILVPVLGLGLHDAAQRFYLEWPAHERRRHLFTLVVCSALSAALICAAIELASGLLFGALLRQVPFDPYLRIALWGAFFGSIGMLPLALLRVQERIFAYSALQLGSFLVQATLGVYLVIFRDQGPYGYLVALFASVAVSAVFSLAVIVRDISPGFSLAQLRASLRYGLPGAVAQLIEAVSSSIDRYFLDKHVPLAQIGLYNLAGQFGSAFNAFNAMLKMSWVPFLYRSAAERDDLPRILGSFAAIYLAVLAVPGLAIALLAEDFIEVFGGEAYRGVYPYVPFFVLYYFVWAAITALGRGMDLAKRTGWWPLVPTAGLIVGLAALITLVPALGVWGAVVAILLAVSARAVVQIGLALRYYPRPLYLSRLVGIVLVGATGFLIGHFGAPEQVLASVIFKFVLLLAAAPALLWVGAGMPNPRRALAALRDRGAD